MIKGLNLQFLFRKNNETDFILKSTFGLCENFIELFCAYKEPRSSKQQRNMWAKPTGCNFIELILRVPVLLILPGHLPSWTAKWFVIDA